MPPKKPPIRSPDFLPIVPNVFPVITFPIFNPPTVAWLRNSPANVCAAAALCGGYVFFIYYSRACAIVQYIL